MAAVPRRVWAAAGVAAAVLSGCSSGTSLAPNTATTPSEVQGQAPRLGEASAKGIAVTNLSVHREGSQLILSGQLHNGEQVDDTLLRISSQVSDTVTLNPPVSIPAGGDLTLGPGGTKAVLHENARLEPGGTLSVEFSFRKAGDVQVFSSFS